MSPDETLPGERFLVELDPGSGGCDPAHLTERTRRAETANEQDAPIRTAGLENRSTHHRPLPRVAALTPRAGREEET